MIDKPQESFHYCNNKMIKKLKGNEVKINFPVPFFTDFTFKGMSVIKIEICSSVN